jgi:hypothetical protein
MPNWCSNTLTISGPSADLVALGNTVVDQGKTDLSLEKINATPPEMLTDEKAGWYEWRNEHWGTKWDVEATLTEFDHLYVYNFNSAWGPPESAIATLAACFPTLTFHLAYDEPGMDFGGFTLWREGELAEKEEGVSLQNLEWGRSWEAIENR